LPSTGFVPRTFSTMISQSN